MKKRNYRLISALLLALLVIQSITLKVYAEDEMPDNVEVITPNSTPSDNSSEGSTDVSSEGSTDSYSEPEQLEPNNETEDVYEKIESMENTIEELDPIITDIKDTEDNGITNPGGAPTTQDLVGDTLEKVDDINKENLTDAQTDIENIKENLEEANKKENEVNVDLAPAVETAVNVDKKANEIEGDVDKLNTDVNILVKDIETATTPEDVNKLFDELTEKVENAGVNLEAQKEIFGKLLEVYEKAVDKLETANDGLSDELTKAKDNAKDLEDKISSLDTEITNLQTSTSNTTTKLADDKTSSENLENDLMDNYKSKLKMWDKARNKSFIIIKEYYIPQFVDKDATEITFDHVKGFDTQDYNYNIVTYKDKEGLKHTLYFNYDMTDKIYHEEDHWKDIGSSGKIVLYEKSVDEINADNYLREYFKGKKINVKNYANSGKLDVFKYTDSNGNVSYMIREEYEKAVSKRTIAPTDAQLIVINANSKAKGGSNYIHELDDEKYNDYLRKSGSLYAKFEEYETKVDKAKLAVDDAKKEASLLTDAVDALKQSKEKLNVINILTPDELEQLKSVMTEEEMINLETMTVKDAIKFLNDLVEKAKKRVDNAVINYNLVKKQRDELASKIDDIIDDVTPKFAEDEKVAGDIIAIESANEVVSTNNSSNSSGSSGSNSSNDKADDASPSQPTTVNSNTPSVPVLSSEFTSADTPVIDNTNLLNKTNDNAKQQAVKTNDDAVNKIANNTPKNVTNKKSSLASISKTNTPADSNQNKVNTPNYYLWITILMLLAFIVIKYLISKKLEEEDKI